MCARSDACVARSARFSAVRDVLRAVRVPLTVIVEQAAGLSTLRDIMLPLNLARWLRLKSLLPFEQACTRARPKNMYARRRDGGKARASGACQPNQFDSAGDS